MFKHIFWIASYPKSGNTLLRSIIASLFFSENGLFDFHLLKKIVSFEEIGRLKKIVEMEQGKSLLNFIDNSNLVYDNMENLQSKSLLGFKEDFAFFKTHFCALFNNKKFIINNNTRGVIYILRDPRDVCISWANHASLSLNKSIDFVLNKDAVIHWTGIDQSKQHKKIPVYISNWENHLISWSKEMKNLPSLIIRFEDLVYNKEAVVNKIIDFFEKEFNLRILNKEIKIENILKSTDFLKLQKREKELGFKEAIKGRQFFSIGRKEQWKDKLEENQVQKIQNKFKATLIKYNYKLS